MNDLSSSLHDWAGRTDGGEPPVEALMAAGNRRRMRTRLVASGGSALALAAVAGVALTQGAPAPAPAASPAMDLAAAASSTTGSTFRFTVTSTVTVPADHVTGSTATCTGAVDPAANSGYLKQPTHLRRKSQPDVALTAETRVVHGDLYSGDNVTMASFGHAGLSALRCGDDADLAKLVSDPVSQLKALGTGVTVTKTAGGYAFTGGGLTGTATVAAGKVTELTYTKSGAGYTEHVTTALSGYGQPVVVQAP